MPVLPGEPREGDAQMPRRYLSNKQPTKIWEILASIVVARSISRLSR